MDAFVGYSLMPRMGLCNSVFFLLYNGVLPFHGKEYFPWTLHSLVTAQWKFANWSWDIWVVYLMPFV